MNLGFFHESSYPAPLMVPLEPFRILSKIHEDVCKSMYLTPSVPMIPEASVNEGWHAMTKYYIAFSLK
jgi:hypothetical protein